MKLKCNHGRRVMVLSSGVSIHRNDGSKCNGLMLMGDQLVTKMRTLHDVPGIPKGTCVLSVEGPRP